MYIEKKDNIFFFFSKTSLNEYGSSPQKYVVHVCNYF